MRTKPNSEDGVKHKARHVISCGPWRLERHTISLFLKKLKKNIMCFYFEGFKLNGRGGEQGMCTKPNSEDGVKHEARHVLSCGPWRLEIHTISLFLKKLKKNIMCFYFEGFKLNRGGEQGMRTKPNSEDGVKHKAHHVISCGPWRLERHTNSLFLKKSKKNILCFYFEGFKLNGFMLYY